MTATKTIAQDVTTRLRYASIVKNDIEGVDDWLFCFQNDARLNYYPNGDTSRSVAIFEDGSMGIVTFDRKTTAREVTGTERRQILEAVQTDSFLDTLSDADMEFFLYLN